MIVFTEYEIKDFAKNPDALRTLANYHDCKAVEAEASDYGECVPAHEARAAELRKEADALEAAY